MNVTQFLPLLGGAGGVGTAVGVILTRRQNRKVVHRDDALLQDEIIGHRNIPGVPDKLGISERLAAVLQATNDLQRSAEDSRQLGEQVAVHAAAVAENLQADAEASARLADLFERHTADDTRRFAESATQLHGISRQLEEVITRVADELTTANGLTIGMLADRRQGRDIEHDVDPRDRTPSQQHYVDISHADDKEKDT